MPEQTFDHREGHLSGARGCKLYWQAWRPREPATQLVVIAHGLGEHGGRHAELAQHLARQGCAVYAMDNRGHGRSDGARAYFDRIAHVEHDLGLIIARAREDHAHLKPLLFGHSIGAVIALSHALRAQSELHGLIMSSPAVAVPRIPLLKVMGARFLSGLRPMAPVYPIDPQAISRDADEVARYENDPLNYHDKIPARTVTRILDRLAWLPATYPVLKLPILILHGSDDRLAPVAGSKDLNARIGSTDKTLKLYDGAFHELFHEYPATQKQVYGDLDDWLATHPKTD